MRLRGISMMVVAMAATALMMGCGAPTDGSERFVDGGRSNAGSYQEFVDSVMADGQLTRMETEQAIEAQISCYEDHGLAGDYGYNLDLYPWVFGGSTQVSLDNPELLAAKAQGDDKAEGRILSRGMGVCRSIFKPVEELSLHSVDLDERWWKIYEARSQCLANAVPEAAAAIDPEWKRLDSGRANAKLYDLQDLVPLGQQGVDALYACMHYPSMTRKTYGRTEQP